MKRKDRQYRFYATLLDTFEGYLNCDKIYQQYYGRSNDPKVSEDEFAQTKYLELIDKINRVPREFSAAADRGIAFNLVLDWCITGQRSDEIEVIKANDYAIVVEYNNEQYPFPRSILLPIVERIKDGLMQVWLEGYLQTTKGRVKLCGYTDAVMPFKITDVKTTKQYKAFKYRDGWQADVYMYCARCEGFEVSEFEYLVTDFKKVYTETYTWQEDTESKLVGICEQFIDFIDQHEKVITDERIYNLEPQKVVS